MYSRVSYNNKNLKISVTPPLRNVNARQSIQKHSKICCLSEKKTKEKEKEKENEEPRKILPKPTPPSPISHEKSTNNYSFISNETLTLLFSNLVIHDQRFDDSLFLPNDSGAPTCGG